MKPIFIHLVVFLSLATFQGNAAIVQVADYALGESGSVSATAPFTPLLDSIGENSIPNWNGDSSKTQLITSGLAADGSTAALQITNNDGLGGTWFGGTVNRGSGYTNNYAFDLWVRPDASGGTFLGATDGNGSTATGLRFWATNASQSGTSLGGNVLSSGQNRLLISNGQGFLGSSASTYTTGQWYRITLIHHDGTVYYYLDESLQDSATMNSLVNDIRLGAGYNAAAGTNAVYDEMKIFTFDPTEDSVASVESAVFTVVPEPSSIALLLFCFLAAGIIGKRKS